MPALAIHRSRSRIPDFDLLDPDSLDQALALLRDDPAIVPLAGGLDVVNRMKHGVAPARLMRLAGLRALRTIHHRPETSCIDLGAMARHDEVATSETLRRHLPDLAAGWDRIATVRIRMQGTVGGNLLARNPGYEGAVLLSAMDGALVVGLGDGEHRMAVEHLPAEIHPGMLAKAVRVPLPPAGTVHRLLYDRSLRPAFSLALSLLREGDCVVSARAVLGGCVAWPLAVALPVGGWSAPRLGREAVEVARAWLGGLPPLTTPWLGATGYRERVMPVVLARLLRDAVR